jgi:hypothetical protein
MPWFESAVTSAASVAGDPAETMSTSPAELIDVSKDALARLAFR